MKKLTFKQIIIIASMLFGMFFGAGNLIFPASMGQLAGSNIWQASPGNQPGGRAAGTEQQSGKEVRAFLYLCALSDYWPVFRHPEMCQRVIYGWD